MKSEFEPFEDRIRRLDLSLFEQIESESSERDQLSWLAIQRIIRTRVKGYTYLEIGSHLGGSIQQHFLDPACRSIYSIDPRPQPSVSCCVDHSFRECLQTFTALKRGCDIVAL